MFIIIESSKDLPCRIVDITPVDTPGASLFKPVVIGTSHLHPLAAMLLLLPPSPVSSMLPGLLPIS